MYLSYDGISNELEHQKSRGTYIFPSNFSKLLPNKRNLSEFIHNGFIKFRSDGVLYSKAKNGIVRVLVSSLLLLLYFCATRYLPPYFHIDFYFSIHNYVFFSPKLVVQVG